MNGLSSELLVIFLLLLVNGVFAMAEIALVSARKSRLKAMADEGDARAAAALKAAEHPARFLSTVQVGITLVGVLAGAFGGGALTDRLSLWLGRWEWIAVYARPLALGVVVTGITLASVVVGELVPKNLGLRRPEAVASALTGMINLLGRLTAPVVVLLDWLTELILRPFGRNGGAAPDAAVSSEEINILVRQGLTAGVFNEAETEMVAGVLELDELPLGSIMTPRPRIVFLNLDDPDEVNWRKIVASGHSRFPVYQTNPDQIIGMVTVKAIWANSAFGLTTPLRDLMIPPIVVPETMRAGELLEQFKRSGQHVALVADEFGSIKGLVTLIDVMEAIVGDLPERGRHQAPEIRRREDGSWLVDATLALAELKELLALDELPHESEAGFKTLGGFVMTFFGRIPAAGDHFEHAGWRFEVVDMDRHRVDKILIAKIPAAAEEEDEATG